MYKILKDGALIALVDKPRYIKFNESSGAYVEVPITQATGIAVHSTPYALAGHELSGSAGTVTVVPVETGEILFTNQTDIAANTAAIDDIIVAMLEV